MKHVDVLVRGAGIVGQSLALSLGRLGLQVGLLYGNLLIVERIFSWPGLGLYTVQSFASSDLPAILGIAMVFGAFYILVTMLVQILQSVADPRIAL